MPRKTAVEDKGVAPPHVIRRNALYDLSQARAFLGLARGTLSREMKLGRLRFSVRAGKRYFLGEWLLQWIQGGEVRKPGNAPGNGHADVQNGEE
jgi:hypothetical protein